MSKKPKKAREWLLKAFFCLAILLLLVFLLKAFKQSNWNSKHHFNLAFWLYNQGGVISFQPKNERVVVVFFPENTLIPAAKGFGDYEARSIYQLGEQEKIGGGRLWQLSTERFLGVITDAYLVNFRQEEKPISKRTLMVELLKSVFRQRKNQSLSYLDALKACLFLNRLRFDQLNMINLVEKRGIKETSLADGSLVYQGREEIIDQLMRTSLVEDEAIQDSLRLVVFNATEESGAAHDFARMVENIGGSVVHVGNSSKINISVIKASEKVIFDKFLVKKIKEKFNFDTEVAESVFQGRGDVGIFLGEDFVRQYLIN